MKKAIIFIIAAFFVSGAATAQQTFRSAYFLDGYNLRHEFNPAFAPVSSYFSLPVSGAFNLQTQSNLGVSTFLYPVNGKLTTFMNSSVQADEFLSKLKPDNLLNLDNRVSLLSVGIRSKKSYITFDVNIKSSAAVNLPYSLFDFMKNAGESQNYNISNLSARMSGVAEAAFGYSRQISDRMNIGARVKLLAGLANVSADIDRMDIQMNEDKWIIQSHGTMKTSSFAKIPTKGETGAEIDKPSDRDLLDFDGIESGGAIVNGYGAALDLGIVAEVIDGLKVSLAVNDLGYILWKNTMIAQTSGEGWSFEGFEDIDLNGGNENSIKNQFDDLTDEVMDMFDFRRTDQNATDGRMLSATVNAGIEYSMPFYRNLTAGLMGSTHINGTFSWSEARLFANLKPVKWFSCSANYGLSKFGSSFGAAIGFHTTGFSMFIGSDHLQFNWAKATEDGILYPYKRLNTSVNFGISFNLGRRP